MRRFMTIVLHIS